MKRYEASPYEFDEEIELELHPVWFIDDLHKPDKIDYISPS